MTAPWEKRGLFWLAVAVFVIGAAVVTAGGGGR